MYVPAVIMQSHDCSTVEYVEIDFLFFGTVVEDFLNSIMSRVMQLNFAGWTCWIGDDWSAFIINCLHHKLTL